MMRMIMIVKMMKTTLEVGRQRGRLVTGGRPVTIEAGQ
jgi:hypothetical protein